MFKMALREVVPIVPDCVDMSVLFVSSKRLKAVYRKKITRKIKKCSRLDNYAWWKTQGVDGKYTIVFQDSCEKWVLKSRVHPLRQLFKSLNGYQILDMCISSRSSTLPDALRVYHRTLTTSLGNHLDCCHKYDEIWAEYPSQKAEAEKECQVPCRFSHTSFAALVPSSLLRLKAMPKWRAGLGFPSD